MDKPGNSRKPTPQAVHSVGVTAAGDAAYLQDVSRTLFAMRDALTQLSLSLKDWQFEYDFVQHGHAVDITQGLLARLTEQAKNKPDPAPRDRA